MQRILRILCVSMGICFVVGMLVSTILHVAQEEGLYLELYESNGVPQRLQMEPEDVAIVNRAVLDYLFGEREDLELVVRMAGEEKAFFNQREKDHMVDVKELLSWGKSAAVILLLFCGGIFIFLLLRRVPQIAVAKGMLYGMTAGLLLLGVIAAFAAWNFTLFWTLFHRVFFRNDLWLLNPYTDNLIVLMPEGFFVGFVQRILLQYGSMCGLILLILGLFCYVKGRRRG